MFFFSVTGSHAQTNTGLHAFFKGSSAVIKSSVQSNSLVFYVSGIDSKTQLDDFLKRAQVYSKGFTLTATSAEGKYECKVNFNGTPEVKWLQRFFVAVSMSDIQQDNEKKSVDDFFKSIQ
jgi:hypothetical protein